MLTDSFTSLVVQGQEVLRRLPSLLQAGFRVATPDFTVANVCSDWLCFTPDAVSGRHFGLGLLIQSNNNGLSAYFGREEWSSITGESDSYPFDISSPFINSGDFFCCNGKGDLSSDNSYISDVSFLMGYVDVTFTFTGSGSGEVDKEHEVRFIIAKDAIAGAERGDLMYKDSGTFKWLETDGDFTETRTVDVITMDEDVVDWENEWGEVGNQEIPVISAQVESEGGGVMQVSESDLDAPNRTYTFKLPATKLVIFPDILEDDVGMISSLVEMMQKIHLRGLPHSSNGGPGNSLTTKLQVN